MKILSEIAFREKCGPKFVADKKYDDPPIFMASINDLNLEKFIEEDNK